MAVAVNPGVSFEFGAPQPLFETGLRFLPQYKIWMDQYAVSGDGQRFLLNRRNLYRNRRGRDRMAVIPG